MTPVTTGPFLTTALHQKSLIFHTVDASGNINFSGEPSNIEGIVREMLHGIRESLRQGQEFDEIVEGLGNDHPRQRGYILGNMLVMEFLEDGRTLLAFAAFIGKGNQVESISRCIRLQVGYDGLVSQLRTLDADGSPLLFQAVSRSSTVECFRQVRRLVSTTLGIGGLVEQMRASDGFGRDMRMHAASSGKIELYEEVTRLYERQKFGEMCKVDNKGRTLLHYAAEGGCPRIVEAVIGHIREISRGNNFLEDYLLREDACGRTPIMCVLSSRHCEHEDADTHEAKVKLIIDVMLKSVSTCDMVRDPFPAEALVHAARGGWFTFVLAMKLRAERLGQKGGYVSTLECILQECSWKDNGEEVAARVENVRAVRTALEQNFHEPKELDRLLVQAALGGHVVVLECVIQAGNLDAVSERLVWSGVSDCRKMATRSDFGFLADELKMSHHPNDQILHESLFALTILSGQREAVEWAASFVMTHVAGKSSRKSRALSQARVASSSKDAFKRHFQSESGKVLSPVQGVLLDLDERKVMEPPLGQAGSGGVKKYAGEKELEAWDILRGGLSNVGSLSYAASAPPGSGVQAFHAVLVALREAAELVFWTEDAKRALRSEFLLGQNNSKGWLKLPPLAAAAFSGNTHLFAAVKAAYTQLGESWRYKEIKHQLVEGAKMNRKTRKLEHEIRFLPPDGGGATRVPAVMWAQILKALNSAEGSHGDLSALRRWFTSAVREAAEQGAFDDLRKPVAAPIVCGLAPIISEILEIFVATPHRIGTDAYFLQNLGLLLMVGFRVEDIVPTLLQAIGDHQQRIIGTIMYAIRRYSNPLVMSAVVSEHIKAAEDEYPSLRKGLKALQEEIDELTAEVLERLPHSVRSVGRAMVARYELKFSGDPEERRQRRERLALLVGLIVMRQILEPTQDYMIANDNSSLGSVNVDPIQQAVDMGSRALDFVNAPLVLDYIRLRFSCTVPGWLSPYPFRHDINAGFSEYFPLRRSKESDTGKRKGGNQNKWTVLLRLLQGWKRDCLQTETQGRSWFLNRTILPGLQFSLAGIIGKPAAFFVVPSIRFVFVLVSYLIMVGLYISCVVIGKSDEIPNNEIAFYVFGLGLLFREVGEFQDAIPSQTSTGSAMDSSVPRDSHGKKHGHQYRDGQSGEPHHRLSVGLMSYLFQDTWNILDTITIFTILVTFVTRILGLGGDWSSSEDDDSGDNEVFLSARGSFFVSRFLLASIAPMLLSRLLFLYQIDATLGPMVQVIWAMLFHLGRFSIFLAAVVTGYALSFEALFSNCNGDLGDAFGTFGTSFITLCEAMLGSPDFDVFDDDESECDGPYWEFEAGIFMLVIFLLVVGVLLLNLLIAVLSTIHDEVHANAEPEFNLAKIKIILKAKKSVSQGILPPPLNVVMIIITFLVDAVSEIFAVFWGIRKWLRDCYVKQNLREVDLHEAPRVLDSNDNGRKYPDTSGFPPLSSTSTWLSVEGTIQRLLFAFTMGIIALGGLILLWTVSVPWIAWHILVWAIRKDKAQANGNDLASAGYFRPLVALVLLGIGWMLAIVVAAGMWLGCVAYCLLLWFRGTWSILEWCMWSCTEGGDPDKQDLCLAVPGEERRQTDDWEEARRIAAENNYRDEDDPEPSHFHVDHFLKMTTGRSMQDFDSVVSRRKKADEGFANGDNTGMDETEHVTHHSVRDGTWGSSRKSFVIRE